MVDPPIESSSTPTLLGLPREIRDKIYSSIIPTPERAFIIDHEDPESSHRVLPDELRKLLWKAMLSNPLGIPKDSIDTTLQAFHAQEYSRPDAIVRVFGFIKPARIRIYSEQTIEERMYGVLRQKTRRDRCLLNTNLFNINQQIRAEVCETIFGPRFRVFFFRELIVNVSRTFCSMPPWTLSLIDCVELSPLATRTAIQCMRREDISSSCLNALLYIWQHRCNITKLRIGEYAIMGVGYGRAIAELVNLVSKIPTLQVIAVIFPLAYVRDLCCLNWEKQALLDNVLPAGFGVFSPDTGEPHNELFVYLRRILGERQEQERPHKPSTSGLDSMIAYSKEHEGEQWDQLPPA